MGQQQSYTYKDIQPIKTENIDVSTNLELHHTLKSAVYNPSCILLPNNTILRSFRVSSFTKCPNSVSEWYYNNKPKELTSKIILQFAPIGEKRREIVLDVQEPNNIPGSSLKYVPGYEDARLIIWKQHILCLVNARSDQVLGRARMYLIIVCKIEELNYIQNNHKCRVIRILSGIDDPSEDEKNWIPIVYEDRLFLIYSLLPYVLLEIKSNDIELTDKNNNKTNNRSEEIILAKNIASNRYESFTKREGSRYIQKTFRESIRLPNGHYISMTKLRGGTQCVFYNYSDKHIPIYIGIGHFRSRQQPILFRLVLSQSSLTILSYAGIRSYEVK